MAKIDYPVVLTKKDWDKKKPLIAKTKSTGIGDLLKNLEKYHGTIAWGEFDFTKHGALASIDGARDIAKKSYGSVKNIARACKDVASLANSWAAKFSKDKLIPKSAAQACKAIADAADDYGKQALAFEQLAEAEYATERKKIENTVRSALKPILSKGVQKVDLFLSDIATFKSSPTKQNLLKLATGDGGARGYCTQCKNWDQILKDFPEIRDPVFKGKAMDTYFPPVREYGANHAPNKWEEMLQDQMQKRGQTEDEALQMHANFLAKQVPEIKKFKGHLLDVLKVIG
ncbi:hypothetical protein [Caenispirillum bisanense]|nr:hypothetical protein [Caenispirillum bisanense]